MPHIHELIDFTADVLVVHNNRVLLRLHDKYGIWLCIGGHIELHEDPVEAAIREVKEETGLDITLVGQQGPVRQGPTTQDERRNLLVPRFMDRHQTRGGHEHIAMIYFAKSDSQEINPADGEPDAKCHWFSKEELESEEYDILPSIRTYALAALEAAQE